jgi:SAM-dependent methyltransferase
MEQFEERMTERVPFNALNSSAVLTAEALIEEAATWCIEDACSRHEKIQREVARYPYMAKQMGLYFIDTSDMDVLDVGGGPVGLSSVIPCNSRRVLDPLTGSYRKFFPCSDHVACYAEDILFPSASFGLVIATNSLDHCTSPEKAVAEIIRVIRPGGYFAHFHAIDNAITHSHPAHLHNINPLWLHSFLDSDFETAWEVIYGRNGDYPRYGWHSYLGKVGQPAFCGLFRKVTGYAR